MPAADQRCMPVRSSRLQPLLSFVALALLAAALVAVLLRISG